MQRLQRIRKSLRFCLVQRDFDSNSSSKVLILFLVVRFVLINSRSLSKRDFVPRRNVSILIFHTRYPSFGFTAAIHGGIIHGKKQIGRVWADAISRRFFEAVASYVAKNLG